MPINEQTINNIVTQRQGKLTMITEKLENIESEEQRIVGFTQYVTKNKDNTYIQDLLNSITEYANRAKLLELMKDYKTAEGEYTKLAQRFSRNTVSIGLFGGTKAGKSTIMKTISGVRDGDYDICIPVGGVGSCTGTLICLEHDENVTPGTITAYLKFKSLPMIRDEIKFSIQKLYIDIRDQISDANILNQITALEAYIATLEGNDTDTLINNLHQIRHITFPNIQTIQIDTDRNLQRTRFVTVYKDHFDTWYEHIKTNMADYSNQNLDDLDTLYHPETPLEIAEFVTFNAPDNNAYYNYPAVEIALMKANLPIAAVQGLRFTDTMGLDDRSNTEIPKRIRDSFDTEVDAAIILINGRTENPQAVEELMTINECIDNDYANQRNIGEWMVAIINRDTQYGIARAQDRKDAFYQTCPAIYEKITDHHVYITNAQDQAEVDNTINKILEFLATTDINAMDQQRINNAEALYMKAKRGYNNLARDLANAAEQIKPAPDGPPTYEIIGRIIRRLTKLRAKETAENPDIWQIETIAKRMLDETPQWIDEIVDNLHPYDPENLPAELLPGAMYDLYHKIRQFGHTIDEQLRDRENTFKVSLIKCFLDEMQFDRQAFNKLGFDNIILDNIDHHRIITEKIYLGEDFFKKLADLLDNQDSIQIQIIFNSIKDFKLTDMTVVTKKLFDEYAAYILPHNSDNIIDLNVPHENKSAEQNISIINNKIKSILQNKATALSTQLIEKSQSIDNNIPNVNKQISNEISNFELCFFPNNVSSYWQHTIYRLYKDKYIYQDNDNEMIRKNQMKIELCDIINKTLPNFQTGL